MFDDRVDHSGQGYCDERADDPCNDDAGGDREDHRKGVHAHRSAEQDRLEHVRLDLLDRENPGKHEQSGDRTVRDEREQHGHHAGRERAHDRDERAEEDDRTDRRGERHPQEQSDHGDANSVDEGHEDGRAREGGELSPGDLSCARDPLPGRPREQPHDPCPDPGTLKEEEEQREQADEQPGNDVRGPEPGLGERRAQPLTRLQRVLGVVEILGELRVTDLEARLQPGLDRLDPGADLRGHLREAAGQLAAHEEQQCPDREDRRQDRQRGGRGGPPESAT